MVNEKAKSQCCGCRACEQICSTNAITMKEDEKGFFYPQIDSSLCTQCGLCDMVCGFRNDYPNHGSDPLIYAVKHKDDTVRQTSTSGGMYTAISDEVLKRGGVIYGVGMDDSLNVCHMRAEKVEERDIFKGSKYVQSDTGDTFTRARRDLESGRLVLYTGTPCQISSLLMFLRIKYENLLTVDIVCHGIPSNKLWQDYLMVIEDNCGDEVVRVQFRNKDNGWHRPTTKLTLKHNSRRKIRGEQSFFQLFNPNLMLMPSCYECKFTNYKRVSDITIADFWGVERTYPDFDDDRGVSLVLVNSPNGREFFEMIRPKLIVLDSSKEHCLQSSLHHPPKKNEKAIEFWEDYFAHGMKLVMKKYTEYCFWRTFMKKAIRKIKRTLGFSVCN